MGYLTVTQVQMLLNIQKEKRPLIGEILVQMGVIEKQQMEQALKKYETINKYRGKVQKNECTRQQAMHNNRSAVVR